MKRKLYLKKSFLISVSIGISVIAIGCSQISKSKYYDTNKFKALDMFLNESYLYDIKANEDEISDDIYKGYVAELKNSATYYISKQEFKQTQIANEGNYFGVGIKMTWETDGHSILVQDVVEGSPAQAAQIKSGDHIVKVDGLEVVEANQSKLLNKLTYSGDQAIAYTIKDEKNQQRTVSLTAKEVILNDLDYQLVNGVGYVDVNSIKTGTSEHLKSLFTKNGEAKGIILDVRGVYTNNVEEISKICDLFLNQGIAFKLENKAKDKVDYLVTEGAYDKPLVLLTDGTTTGATEALVSALKEKAVQIGSDTYGLVYVSEIVPLEDGSGLCVATGILCDQYGEELPHKGIEPDIRVYMTDKEKLEYIEKGSVSKENDSAYLKALEQF